MISSAIRRLWTRWRRVAHALGVIQTWVGLTLIYWLLVVPLGGVVRMCMDPLGLRGRGGWRDREARPGPSETARRQS